MARILIIDDDEELAALFSEYLQKEGFYVANAFDGKTGLAQLNSQHFSLMILDIMLPDMSGIDLLNQIRQQSLIPVLMLTAKGDDIDRITGLESGADDYVTKPCSPRELVARVRAILRRSQSPSLMQSELTVGALRLQIEKREVFWNEQHVYLTSTEFNLLKILAENSGSVVSKDDLSLHALGRPLARFDRSIDVHISSIRQKLSQVGVEQPIIKTVRGQGYLLIRE